MKKLESGRTARPAIVQQDQRGPALGTREAERNGERLEIDDAARCPAAWESEPGVTVTAQSAMLFGNCTT
jgi:hypothetical protein